MALQPFSALFLLALKNALTVFKRAKRQLGINALNELPLRDDQFLSRFEF